MFWIIVYFFYFNTSKSKMNVFIFNKLKYYLLERTNLTKTLYTPIYGYAHVGKYRIIRLIHRDLL